MADVETTSAATAVVVAGGGVRSEGRRDVGLRIAAAEREGLTGVVIVVKVLLAGDARLA